MILSLFVYDAYNAIDYRRFSKHMEINAGTYVAGDPGGLQFSITDPADNVFMLIITSDSIVFKKNGDNIWVKYI